MDETGEEDLQYQGAENDEENVPKDVEAAGKVELADVAGVGDGEAEEVDKVKSQGESDGL